MAKDPEDAYKVAKRAARKAYRDILGPAQTDYNQAARAALNRCLTAIKAALGDYHNQLFREAGRLAQATSEADDAYWKVLEAHKKAYKGGD